MWPFRNINHELNLEHGENDMNGHVLSDLHITVNPSPQ